MSYITESHIEQATLEILSDLKYTIIYGPDIAPDSNNPERDAWDEVILKPRLKDAIERLNPGIPKEAQEEALKKVLRTTSPNLIKNNERFHNFLVNGITIPCRIKGEIKKMARELSQYIKTNTSIDWKLRESVRAKLRIGVKRLLKKYGYPPDKQKMANDLVLEQAEVLSDRWVNKEEDTVNLYIKGNVPEMAVAEKCAEKFSK